MSLVRPSTPWPAARLQVIMVCLRMSSSLANLRYHSSPPLAPALAAAVLGGVRHRAPGHTWLQHHHALQEQRWWQWLQQLPWNIPPYLVGIAFPCIVLDSLRTLAEHVYPEAQCQFGTRRSTVDMSFSLRQTEEKCHEQGHPLYIAFINLTKAFDLVSCQASSLYYRESDVPPQSF